MSAFGRHGISHLSPSSLNLWVECPGLWPLRYLANVRDAGGPKAWRGTATERGVELLLRGKPVEEAIAFAQQEFAKLSVDGDTEEQLPLVAPMVRQAAMWRDKETVPPIAATQLKVETWLDGVPIPIIGYVDFTFMDDFPDVDLKTTQRLPSSPSVSHVRQVALYHQARQRTASLLYVTDKRHAHYIISPEDCAKALGDLRSAALSLESFLSRVDSALDALHCLPLNTDDFRVNQATIDAHAQLLGA